MANRPYTTAELRFIRDNPHLTNLEVALRLNRSLTGISIFRKRHNLNSRVNYYQQIYAS